MAGARLPVDAPPFTPRQFGLFSAATPVPDTGPHWQNGITYQPNCGMGSITYDECLVVTGAGGGPPAPSNKTGNITMTTRGSTPFTPYVEFDCSPVGNADAALAAQRALLRTEEFQVERAFWTGKVAGLDVVWPRLAWNATTLDPDDAVLGTAAVVVTGGAGALSVAHGLGILEDALADCYGGVGTIHIPLQALPTFAAWGLAVRSGSQLYTPAGNLIAVGAGYLGTSPAGATPTAGETWIYATSQVFMYRSDVKARGSASDSLDRTVNTMKMIAERTYVLGWECCHLAMLINIGVPEGT